MRLGGGLEPAVQDEGRVEAVTTIDQDGRVARAIDPDGVRAQSRQVTEREALALPPVGTDHGEDVADLDGVDHQVHHRVQRPGERARYAVSREVRKMTAGARLPGAE